MSRWLPGRLVHDRRTRLVIGLVLSGLIAGCASANNPSASTNSQSCTVAVELVDGGPGIQITGSGFEPDQPATLTFRGESSDPVTFTQTTNPALRTDIRGVVLFATGADRENIGTARIELAAGGCTASGGVEILEAMFPPACPAGDPVASGGAEAEAYAALVLAARPVAYWRFEEEEGPLSVAAVGSAGAHQGEVAVAQPGPIAGSRALGLRGNGARVDITDLTIPGDFTIEGWLYFCDDPIDSADALFGPVPNLNFHEATARLWDGDTDVVVADGEVVHARWYHVALVRAGSHVALYLDGAVAGEGEFHAPIAIGALGDADIGTTTGLLDEVAIYDHALTVEQLAARVAAAS